MWGGAPRPVVFLFDMRAFPRLYTPPGPSGPPPILGDLFVFFWPQTPAWHFIFSPSLTLPRGEGK